MRTVFVTILLRLPPGIYAKTVLYRPSRLTNVYVQPFYGMYNDVVLGAS